MLNRHCQICEFCQRCHIEATAKDDLSLPQGLSEKEIRKYNKRGILTVTQLSCTFRPHKRNKRLKQKGQLHHPALQALAIRDKKIYVLGTLELPCASTQIYFRTPGSPLNRSNTGVNWRPGSPLNRSNTGVNWRNGSSPCWHSLSSVGGRVPGLVPNRCGRSGLPGVATVARRLGLSGLQPRWRLAAERWSVPVRRMRGSYVGHGRHDLRTDAHTVDGLVHRRPALGQW